VLGASRLRIQRVTIAAIFGAGDIGGAIAQALAVRHSADRVLLVDRAESAARGKALDIQQSGAIIGFDTRLLGTSDAAQAAATCRGIIDNGSGASVCIVADRFGSPSKEWEAEEGMQLVRELAPHLGSTPVVFGGMRQAGLMADAARDGHLRASRIMGSCAEAMASAVRAIVAMEARCAPTEVLLSVLGAPPGFVIPWSDASIGGYALDAVLTPPQLARVSARSARLWPLQPYALGMAAAILAEGILGSARRAFNTLAVLDGEFGVRGGVGALPVQLGSTGIVHRRLPSLTTRERVQLETALAAGRT
jgi:malate dehydrogenase